jgi:hypothetical protein
MCRRRIRINSNGSGFFFLIGRRFIPLNCDDEICRRLRAYSCLPVPDRCGFFLRCLGLKGHCYGHLGFVPSQSFLCHTTFILHLCILSIRYALSRIIAPYSVSSPLALSPLLSVPNPSSSVILIVCLLAFSLRLFVVIPPSRTRHSSFSPTSFLYTSPFHVSYIATKPSMLRRTIPLPISSFLFIIHHSQSQCLYYFIPIISLFNIPSFVHLKALPLCESIGAPPLLLSISSTNP